MGSQMRAISNNLTVYIDGPSAKCWKTLTVYASSKVHKALIILKSLRLAKARVASSNLVSRSNSQSVARDLTSPSLVHNSNPPSGNDDPKISLAQNGKTIFDLCLPKRTYRNSDK